jgi:hypothetical protein
MQSAFWHHLDAFLQCSGLRIKPRRFLAVRIKFSRLDSAGENEVRLSAGELGGDFVHGGVSGHARTIEEMAAIAGRYSYADDGRVRLSSSLSSLISSWRARNSFLKASSSCLRTFARFRMDSSFSLPKALLAMVRFASTVFSLGFIERHFKRPAVVIKKNQIGRALLCLWCPDLKNERVKTFRGPGDSRREFLN